MNEVNTSLQEKRFAQWFCVMFVCLGAIVFVFKRTDLFPWVGVCNAAGYDSEHYMAYCHSTRYGDYEHFALYNGLEPTAVDALKQASVLFLGNSNTQYAFSTSAVSDYFERRGVSHYVMGFGQGAQSPVAHAVMKKHQLQPQMLVANIDPFFSTETNGTFQRVLDGDEKLAEEFKTKQQLQRWQSKICAQSNSRWARWACQGEAETLYRSRSNGHWVTDYYRDNQRHPVTHSTDLLDKLNAAEQAANDFIDSFNVPRECIVLTLTPRTGTPTDFAKALSAKLGLALIEPTLDNLVTIDHSHLDKDSAMRWSTAFITEFDSYAQRCASTANHASID